MSREITISTANRSDINKIYDLAKGRYLDHRINGPGIKYPWWRKNPLIFYVIHDDLKNVCANINLLPLNQNCYSKLKYGVLEEREISPDEIFSIEQKNLVTHIYVEGFNCKKKIYAHEILINLPKLISNLATPPFERIRIGACAGTQYGENLMKNLGFKLPVELTAQKTEFLFLETDYLSLVAHIDRKVMR